MTEANKEIMKIFFPETHKRQDIVRDKSLKFAHYTTALAAVSIFKNKNVWLRKSNHMNDYTEIEHGLRCIKNAYSGNVGAELNDILNNMHPGFSSEFENLFNGWLPHFQSGTYLTCLSEHTNDDDVYGKLSMWRAYGGDTGVAIILKRDRIIGDRNIVKAYSVPVTYAEENEYINSLSLIVKNMNENKDFISTIDREPLKCILFNMFRFSMLSTKHPGFYEEKEWRVVHCPKFDKSDYIKEEIETINGIPQLICKLPLDDFPDDIDDKPSIANTLDRVIISPTKYPLAIRDAIVDVLSKCGVGDAEQKVFVSTIPLRQ